MRCEVLIEIRPSRRLRKCALRAPYVHPKTGKALCSKHMMRVVQLIERRALAAQAKEKTCE